MTGLTSILTTLAGPVFIVLLLTAFLLRKKQSNCGKKKGAKKVSKSVTLKRATDRLSRNPNDADALQTIGRLYYEDKAYKLAFRCYEILTGLCANASGLDEFEINLRYGICAFKLKKYKEAYRGLAFAKTFNRESVELAYHLGCLEVLRKNYKKAEELLEKVKRSNANIFQINKYLGFCYCALGKYELGAKALQQWLEVHPDDTEYLFLLGQAYQQMKMAESALSIYSKLRTNQAYGPKACLFAGTIRMNRHSFRKAIEDFEIGLSHEAIPPELVVKMRYLQAKAFIEENEIADAVDQLNRISSIDPRYKDVPRLLEQYSEVNDSQNLKSYLLAPFQEFTALCRNIAQEYFKSSRTEIVSITSPEDLVLDIAVEVVTRSWEESILFRFIRSSGFLGDLCIRDFHSQMRDTKVGRGIIVTAGEFNDKAKEYVEARTINLVEKKDLLEIFNTFEKKKKFVHATPQVA